MWKNCTNPSKLHKSGALYGILFKNNHLNISLFNGTKTVLVFFSTLCYSHVLLQKPRNQKRLSLGQSTFSTTLWRNGPTTSAASQTGWSSISGPNSTLASYSIQVGTDSYPPSIMKHIRMWHLMSDSWRGRIDRFRIMPSRHNK